jgi:tRNA (mo5U34)-methyltransferase
MADPTATLRQRVDALPWYHLMRLPGGIVTPGVVDVERALPKLSLPESLAGKSVLDVGAWDGFYSFECARRGASRVMATDSYSWDGRGWGSKDGFLLAREALGLGDVVEDRLVEPADLDPVSLGGPFDVVLFLGVLYHVRDPITALEKVAACCSDLLIIENETALNWLPFAAARLFPGRELADDPTNWFQLNTDAHRGLLAEFGFGAFDVVYRQPVHRRLARSVIQAGQGEPFRQRFRSHRVVVHARRTVPA